MAADAPLVAEMAKRPTDELRVEQKALRRELTATESRQRMRDRLTQQRAAAERLLDDAERRAATSGLPGDIAVARQAARRVADLRERETQFAQHGSSEPETTQRRLGAIDTELQQRATRTGRVAELAPADYLLAALGPRPERLAQRARWRQVAWRIEQARDATGHTGSHDALGTEPRDLRPRELWHDTRREIERYRREVEPALEQRREAPPERELG